MKRGSTGKGDRGQGTTVALILSGSIGKGHDSVAEACGAALRGAGVQVRTLDCMTLLGKGGSRAGMSVFRFLIGRPTVYDGFHFSHLRAGTRVARAMQRASDRQLVPRLEAEEIPQGALVLAVFPTGVSAAVAVKRHRPDLRVITVCTDACAHAMWVHEHVDLCVVCSMLAANTVRRYDPDAAIALVAPPVRASFYRAPSRAEARRALGIGDASRCVLLMSGGWGRGPLAETAAVLAAHDYEVLAVAGMNRSLEKRLRALARRSARVHAFGMTAEVPSLMAAADAVVTSPGQTCHEARVVGRWLVVLDVVPGHGRENTIHEIESGGALACSPDPQSVLGAVRLTFQERPAVVPWPVRTAEEWDKQFLGALADAAIEL